MIKKISIICIATLVSGCSGIMSGGDDNVTINTGTADAKIFVDGNYLGNGRLKTKLERGEMYEIRAEKKNCLTAFTETDQSLSNWFWANILIDYGIISMPIDLISGNAWRADKEIYTVIPLCEEETQAEKGV